MRERISTARAEPSHHTFDNEENLKWKKNLESTTLCLPSSFLLGLTYYQLASGPCIRRRQRQPQCANRGRETVQTSDAYRHVGESEKGEKIWETFSPKSRLDWRKKDFSHMTEPFFLLVKISRSLNPPHDIFRLFFINFANCSKTSRLLYIYIFMINILIYKHLDILFWTVWGPRLNFCFRLVKLRCLVLPSKRVQKKEKFFGYFFELLYS